MYALLYIPMLAEDDAVPADEDVDYARELVDDCSSVIAVRRWIEIMLHKKKMVPCRFGKAMSPVLW